MQIQRYYRIERPRVEGSHIHYGQFVCDTSDERENNLIARFVEDVWMRAGGRDYTVSFVPSLESDLLFLVNGKTERVVRDVIDEAIAKIEHGFKKCRLPVTVKSVSR